MKTFVLIVAVVYLSVLMDEARGVVVVSSPIRPDRYYYGSAQEAERMLMHARGGQQIRGVRSPGPFRGNFQQRPVYSGVAPERRYGRSPQVRETDPLSIFAKSFALAAPVIAAEESLVKTPAAVETPIGQPPPVVTPPLVVPPTDAITGTVPKDVVPKDVPVGLPSTGTETADDARRKRADAATSKSHGGR